MSGTGSSLMPMIDEIRNGGRPWVEVEFGDAVDTGLGGWAEAVEAREVGCCSKMVAEILTTEIEKEE